MNGQVSDGGRPMADATRIQSARELAYRCSGEIEVFLFWDPALDRVELCVLDSTTGVSVHVDVAPDRALDAFDHPYAYLAQPKSALPPAPIESTPAPIRDRRE